MSAVRRSGRDRDWTDMEGEGLPEVDDQAPGIGPDTAQDGIPIPADHPLAVEEDGVTAWEESRPETLRQRVARERPDVPQAPPDGPGGRLRVGGDDDELDEAEWVADDAGLSAEEAAIHIDFSGRAE